MRMKCPFMSRRFNPFGCKGWFGVNLSRGLYCIMLCLIFIPRTWPLGMHCIETSNTKIEYELHFLPELNITLSMVLYLTIECKHLS